MSQMSALLSFLLLSLATSFNIVGSSAVHRGGGTSVAQ